MNYLILATEAAEEADGPLGIVLPAAAELVYGALAFAIVYFILAKFAFPQLNEVLEERKAAIQGKMEDADKAMAEAKKTKADYEAQLNEARGEANRLIEEAKSTAESLRRDIVAKAEAEAQAIVSRAQAEVSAERDRALQELRSEVGAMSVELASKIVGKELDQASHQDLVDQYINQLSSQN